MSRSKHKNSGDVAGVTIHDIGNGKGILFIWGGIVSFWGTGPECREYMKVAAAIQNSGQCYHVIEDKKKRVTAQTSLDNFLKRLDRIESSKGTRTCFIKVRYEWNCNLPSVCYCWQSFSSTISHLLSLLQSVQFSSVQFSRSVVSDSLGPHESQHARPPCPTPTPGVHWDSHPLSQWCHPAISSSFIPFSSFLQTLPASKSFPMSQLFPWGGQHTGVSALASSLPKKSQGWSPSE